MDTLDLKHPQTCEARPQQDSLEASTHSTAQIPRPFFTHMQHQSVGLAKPTEMIMQKTSTQIKQLSSHSSRKHWTTTNLPKSSQKSSQRPSLRLLHVLSIPHQRQLHQLWAALHVQLHIPQLPYGPTVQKTGRLRWPCPNGRFRGEPLGLQSTY